MIDISLFKSFCVGEQEKNTGDNALEAPATSVNSSATEQSLDDFFTPCRRDKVKDSSRPELEQQLLSIDTQIEKTFATYNRLRTQIDSLRKAGKPC